MVLLTTELRYKPVQHTDKIGNQYLLEYPSETFEGGGDGRDTVTLSRWSRSTPNLIYFWPGFDSPVILVHVGCLGYRFFLLFSPNIDKIDIIFGLSRKNKNSREGNNRDWPWRRGRKKTKEGTSQ